MNYRDFLIRSWETRDRSTTAKITRSVSAEYGLGWELEESDRDVL